MQRRKELTPRPAPVAGVDKHKRDSENPIGFPQVPYRLVPMSQALTLAMRHDRMRVVTMPCRTGGKREGP